MTSEQKDYYEILGIKKEATPEEIRKAYKKLAIKWHPDKHVDDKKEAEEKFKEIAEAYSVLSDPDKKREYDDGGVDFDFGDFDNFDPFAMFKSFFGKHGFDHFGFGFDDDEEEDLLFGKNFGFGFNDDDFGMGGGQGKSVKKTTQIINGKKITKTETTTIDSKGNKKTVIKEESGGKVREYLLGEKGEKIDMNLKKLTSEEKQDNKDKDEGNFDENEEHHHRKHHRGHHHKKYHGYHGCREDNNKKFTNKKRYNK